MIDNYLTNLDLDVDDAIALERLLNDFSARCRREGIWARGFVDVYGISSDDKRLVVNLKLCIDDDLRCNKPGRNIKSLKMKIEDMAAMHRQGISMDKIAKQAGISRATAYRRLNRYLDEPVDHAY